MKDRTIRQVKLQHHLKTKQYIVTVPSWIVKKVLDAKKGDKLEWDFKGDKAILKKVD